MKQRDTKNAPQNGNATTKDKAQRLEDYARLVSDLVHEFRTPLGSIVGAASVLDQYDDKLDEAAKSRICAGIMEQAYRLDGLYTALAAMARSRTGTLVRERQVFELNELLRGLWASNSNRHAGPGGISLLHEEVFLETDPAAIRTTLTTMLGLAVLFAPEDGGPSLSLAHEEGRAIITVECPVGTDEKPRLEALLSSQRTTSNTNAGEKADAICLAAIKEVVHSLDGDFEIKCINAGDRLCQTVRLEASTVPAGLGEA